MPLTPQTNDDQEQLALSQLKHYTKSELLLDGYVSKPEGYIGQCCACFLDVMNYDDYRMIGKEPCHTKCLEWL